MFLGSCHQNKLPFIFVQVTCQIFVSSFTYIFIDNGHQDKQSEKKSAAGTQTAIYNKMTGVFDTL